MAQFRASLTYSRNRYTEGMPKPPTISSLLNNHHSAALRLERKLINLEKNPSRYQRYHQELLKFIERGYAVEIPDPVSTIATTNDGCFYMPHREVVTSSGSIEKWRIVFDCSAKTKGSTSLNDHLLAGPSLNPELVTLLLNFRVHRVAVSADITQAYMRIAVTEEDQRYFRFLWRYPGEDVARIFQTSVAARSARCTGNPAPYALLLRGFHSIHEEVLG